MIDEKKKVSHKAGFLLICFILMALSVSCEKGKPYVNDMFGFKAQYPDKWNVNDTGFLGTAVVFVSTQPENDFKPSVNVFVRNSEDLSLQQFVNKSKKGLDTEIKDVGYKLKKFLAEGKIKFARHKGYYLTYLFSQGGIDLEGKSLYLVEGDRAFILTCTAKESDFGGYESEFDYIVNSFRIK